MHAVTAFSAMGIVETVIVYCRASGSQNVLPVVNQATTAILLGWFAETHRTVSLSHNCLCSFLFW